MLSLFDERTWQKDLMSGARRAALAGLDEAALQRVFRDYASSNHELDEHLQTHREKGLDVAHPLRGMPCAFAGPHPSQAADSDFTGSEALHRMLLAERQMREDPDQWRQGVEVILTQLQQLAASTNRSGADWSPVHFAALSAVMSEDHGDFPLADRLLELGMSVEPQSARLRYLSRIFGRERTAGR